jgi:hypothetical protein
MSRDVFTDPADRAREKCEALAHILAITEAISHDGARLGLCQLCQDVLDELQRYERQRAAIRTCCRTLAEI